MSERAGRLPRYPNSTVLARTGVNGADQRGTPFEAAAGGDPSPARWSTRPAKRSRWGIGALVNC